MSAPKVKVRLRDQEWVFEIRLTLAEAFMLKEGTGLTPAAFLAGQQEMDPTCIQALLWLCHHRAGNRIRLAEVPTDFDLWGDEFEMEDLTDPTPGDATPSASDATA